MSTYSSEAGPLGSGLPGRGAGFAIGERAQILVQRGLSVYEALDQARQETLDRMPQEGTIAMHRPEAVIPGATGVAEQVAVLPVEVTAI